MTFYLAGSCEKVVMSFLVGRGYHIAVWNKISAKNGISTTTKTYRAAHELIGEHARY